MDAKDLKAKMKDKIVLTFNKQPITSPMYDFRLSAGAPCNDPKLYSTTGIA